MTKKKFATTLSSGLNTIRRDISERLPRKYTRHLLIASLIVAVGSAIYLLARPQPTSAEWWNDAWHFRRPVTITYTGSSSLTEYQVLVDGLDTATYISDGKLQPDCDDLRYVTDNGIVLNYSIVGNTCNTSDTEIWVQVDSIPAQNVTVYMYYGNFSAEPYQSEEATFSYSNEKTVGYVLDNSVSDLQLISLSEDNSLTHNEVSKSLVKYETDSFTSISQWGAVTATKPFNADDNSADTDTLVPISWAGTEFVTIARNTTTHYFRAIALWGTATVDIIHAGTDCTGNTVTSAGSNISCTVTQGHIRVTATNPILLFHDQGDTIDPLPIPPSTTAQIIGTGGTTRALSNASGADYRYWSSDNASETNPADLGADSFATIANSSFGSAPALLVRTVDNAISVIQGGDGGGSDSHHFQLLREMGSTYGSANATNYISVASDKPAYCEVRKVSDGSLVGSGTATSSNSSVYFLGFGTGDGNDYVTEAWYMECDAQVAAYYDKDAGGDESNLWTYPMMRQYTYPEPTAGSPGTEEKSESPIAHWNFNEGYGGIMHNSKEINGEGGLVGWWEFNEGTGPTVYDMTGRNNLTLTGSPSYTNSGRTVRAIDWESTSDEIGYVADDEILSITGDLTLSAWINPESVTAATVFTIATKATTGISASTSYQLSQYGDEIRMYINSGSDYETTDAADLSINNWYHVAGVYDASEQTVTLYVNGQPEASTTTGTIPSSITDRAENFTVGALNYSGIGSITQDYDGEIDSVRLYRKALTQTDVEREYNSLHAYSFDYADRWADGAQPNSDRQPMGTSFDFINSAGDYLSAQDHNSFDFDDGDDFSISTWVTKEHTSAQEVVLAKRNGTAGSDVGYMLYFNTSDQIVLEVADGTDEFSVIGNALTDTSNWHHIVAVFDESSSSGCKIYLDGKDYTNTTSGTIGNVGSIANSVQLVMGTESDTGSNYLEGPLDEVKIFDYALTQDQARLQYNEGFSAQFGVGDDGDSGNAPTLYYKLDEGFGYTTFDSSGSNNHGELLSMDPESNWAQGKYGNAVDFGGVGSDDMIALTSQITLADNAAWTISYWVYDDSTSGGTIAMGDEDDDNNYIWHDQAIGSPSVDIKFDDTTTKSFEPVPSPEEWHHISIVCDGSATANLDYYVDGVLADSDTHTDTELHIENIADGYATDNNYSFNGRIDEVKIYGYARTPNQIVMDMEGGHPPGGSPVPSQTGYWKFDEGYGDTAQDSSANGYDGNLAGAGVSCPTVSSACPTWTNSGYVEKGLWFDGSDDWVHLDNLNTDIDTDNGTISAWIKPEAMTDVGVVFSAFVNTSNTIDMFWSDSANDFRFRYIGGGTTKIVTTSEISDADSTWHYVAMTWDTTANEIVAYVDGRDIGDAQSLGTWSGTILDYVSIGSQGDSDQGFHFKGTVDEVKIYSSALTAAQIRTDFNLGKSLVLGVAGTDSSGNSSRGSDRSYCPPGDSTSSCAPILEWKLDEGTGTSAYDTSTSESTGTLTSMESTDWVYGTYGKALDFLTDDYVLGSNESTYDFGSGSFTATGWFKHVTSVNAQGEVIFSKSWYGTTPGSPNAKGFQIYLTSSGNLCFGIDDDTTWDPDDSACGGDYDDEEWHHFVAIKSSTSSIRSYVDGLLIATDATISATGSLDNNINITIGNAYYNGGIVLDDYYYDGLIDHIQLFDYAFNEEQVAWNYNRGKPIAHWKLDESSGTTAYDSGVYEIDGTLNNFPATCWTDGVISGAIDVDGSDDYISSSANDALNFGDGSQDFPMSIAAWVNMDDATDFVIMNRGNTALTNSQEWTFRTNGSDQLRLVLYDSTESAYIDQESDSALTTSQNSWIHVAATYSGSGAASGITLYVNGQEVASTAGSNSYTAMHNLGGIWQSIGAYLPLSGSKVIADGTIDDVRVYRYELFPQQIRDIYNQGAAVRFPD